MFRSLCVAFMAVCAVCIGVGVAAAGTLQVGDKVKLETGFGEAYVGNLEQVSYAYKYYNAYLALDESTLGTGDVVESVTEDGVVTGVFTGTARDGIVSAPVFEAVAATPIVDGVRETTSIFDVTVSAVSPSGKSINVQKVLPEPLSIEPEPEEPTISWLFRWTTVTD